ncbi:MAG: tRNA preQ1(34) S-adenosylmethionine ribosyltransferase-isomerase QueA [Elusimicrobiota bacterium]|jgi:S-adenosylmethionine:tRNA ribosyltransferase-isomerase|nr:tRNA preQ1(34) S-adenosylmethionine ribosyltransferase-isomerase QueA [Elusimicrobiota bacterium]
MIPEELLLSNYDYDIFPELIAQKPVENRQDSKLFVIDRKNGKFHHKNFTEIIDYLDIGDCLVLNSTKVVPSRLFGVKKSGGKVELLFLNPCQSLPENKYRVLMKPFIAAGNKVFFKNEYECEVLAKELNGEVIVKFNKSDILDFLQQFGIMPLPPYINRKNGLAQELSDFDRKRYQTVYAQYPGAIAAPTAGLHFTEKLLSDLTSRGIRVAMLTLHVGWGTFKPIISQNICQHKMLAEKFTIDAKNAEMINYAKKENKRIIAVGTTSTRAMETIAAKVGFEQDGKVFIKQFDGETSIFIYPGYKFKIIDSLITNLHLPKSTPLMMASAFAGRKKLLSAYKEAIKNKYKFFSYGDSMLIL